MSVTCTGLHGGYHLAVCAESCDERKVPILEEVLWDETKGQYVRMPDGFKDNR